MSLLFAALLFTGSKVQDSSAPLGKKPGETLGFLIELTGKFLAVGIRKEDKPQVFFPLPRSYRGQAPLSFDLKVSPESALVSRRIVEGKCGDRVMELTFTPMKRGSKVQVEWTSAVFADAEERNKVKPPETVPFPDRFPAEARPWVFPSLYVQSRNARIREAAAKMRGQDVMETIRKTMAGTRGIMSRQRGFASDLSSLEALDHVGSCVSNATLLAAMLRANDIPARILSGYPTWATAPYQTHYIVEAYVPNFGWYPLEPTIGATGWPCSEMPIVSIVPVEYENKGEQRRAIGAGVPYLSLTESSEGVIVGGLMAGNTCDHASRTLGLAKLPLGTFAEKQARWEAWLAKANEAWMPLVNDVELPKTD